LIKKLFGNNVAIVPIVDQEEKTTSGIILTNKKGTKKQFGKVVAVGNGLMLQDGTRAKIEVEIGSTVIYKQYAGVQIHDGARELLVVDMKDIIAEIE
jgi:chaperonin GroES